jgi:hypothetical protein
MGDAPEDVDVDEEFEVDTGLQDSLYDMGGAEQEDMEEEPVTFGGFDEPEADTAAALVASSQDANDLYGNTDDMMANVDEQTGTLFSGCYQHARPLSSFLMVV